MKEAIAILTGGGPAPGMNTVVGSVAKTFLAKGYRVIGLHHGYSGLKRLIVRYEPPWLKMKSALKKSRSSWRGFGLNKPE